MPTLSKSVGKKLSLHTLFVVVSFSNFFFLRPQPSIIAGFEISQMAAQAKAIESKGKIHLLNLKVKFIYISLGRCQILKEYENFGSRFDWEKDIFFEKKFEVFLRHHE